MAVELYDEHEQSERVRKWLQDNGVAVVMGLVLALAGILGWRQWQDYQANQALMANEYYAAVQREIEAGDLEQARAQLDQMSQAVGKHAYATLAALLVASMEISEGELDAAADRLRGLEETGRIQALAPVIRLRRALVEIAREQPESALALLGDQAPGGMEALWHELKGDALAALGRHSEAVAAYEQAVERYRGDGQSFRVVQIKLDAAVSRAGTAENS